jgi:hypothetical protein
MKARSLGSKTKSSAAFVVIMRVSLSLLVFALPLLTTASRPKHHSAQRGQKSCPKHHSIYRGQNVCPKHHVMGHGFRPIGVGRPHEYLAYRRRPYCTLKTRQRSCTRVIADLADAEEALAPDSEDADFLPLRFSTTTTTTSSTIFITVTSSPSSSSTAEPVLLSTSITPVSSGLTSSDIDTNLALQVSRTTSSIPVFSSSGSRERSTMVSSSNRVSTSIVARSSSLSTPPAQSTIQPGHTSTSIIISSSSSSSSQTETSSIIESSIQSSSLNPLSISDLPSTLSVDVASSTVSATPVSACSSAQPSSCVATLPPACQSFSSPSLLGTILTQADLSPCQVSLGVLGTANAAECFTANLVDALTGSYVLSCLQSRLLCNECLTSLPDVCTNFFTDTSIIDTTVLAACQSGLGNFGLGAAAQCFNVGVSVSSLTGTNVGACLRQSVPICSTVPCSSVLSTTPSPIISTPAPPSPTPTPCVAALPSVCQVPNSGLLAPVLLTVNTVACQLALNSLLPANPAALCFSNNLLSTLTGQDFTLCLSSNFPLCP